MCETEIVSCRVLNISPTITAFLQYNLQKQGQYTDATDDMLLKLF